MIANCNATPEHHCSFFYFCLEQYSCAVKSIILYNDFCCRTVQAKDVEDLEKKVDLVSLKAMPAEWPKDFDPTTGKLTLETVSESSKDTTHRPAKTSPSLYHVAQPKEEQSHHKTLDELGKPEGCKLKHR